MRTLIHELGEMLEKGRGVTVRMMESEMLVTLPVGGGGGRKQTVSVATRQGRHGDYSILKFRSRAFIASSPKLVSGALKGNAKAEWGGLVLDTSSTPPVVDVAFSLVVDQLDPNHVFATLQRVAEYADSLEERFADGADDF